MVPSLFPLFRQTSYHVSTSQRPHCLRDHPVRRPTGPVARECPQPPCFCGVFPRSHGHRRVMRRCLVSPYSKSECYIVRCILILQLGDMRAHGALSAGSQRAQTLATAQASTGRNSSVRMCARWEKLLRSVSGLLRKVLQNQNCP
jgi:hypothetical protein